MHGCGNSCGEVGVGCGDGSDGIALGHAYPVSGKRSFYALGRLEFGGLGLAGSLSPGFLSMAMKKTFAAYYSRQEVIGREVAAGVGLGYGAAFELWNFKRTGIVVSYQMCHYVFILGEIECAGAVDHDAARTQSAPQRFYNCQLAGGTRFNQTLRPLSHGLGIFAHHALARAGNISGHYVEKSCQDL